MKNRDFNKMPVFKIAGHIILLLEIMTVMAVLEEKPL